MLFSRRLPLSTLIELCRAMRHYLSAGLSLNQVFAQQARKGTLAIRPVAARISAVLGEGDDLGKALAKEGATFPPLFISLAVVGEETGMLPEVCRELESYFLLQQKLRRQFVMQIAWPLFQFVAALAIVTGLIWILGAIGDARPDAEHFDPLGFGVGAWPALRFLLVVLGTLFGLLFLLLFASRVFGAGLFDSFLLRVPVVGSCLRALALTRFCRAMRLTLETAMSTARALRLSLNATGNGAFARVADQAQTAVKRGDELSVALEKTGLFPEEFRMVLVVGEESGRLTEVLEQQGEVYEGKARRRMMALTVTSSVLVWMGIGALIIFCIFRMFLSYLDLLDPEHYGI
jgi:type II secretory pathway component PulF